MSSQTNVSDAVDIAVGRLGDNLDVRVESSNYLKTANIVICSKGFELRFSGNNYGVNSVSLIDNVKAFFERIDKSRK